MFRKVHIRLTLLCAGITSLILIAMSALYLYLSESSLEKNQFLSFQRDMGVLLSDLYGKTMITHQWISSQEANGTYLLMIQDNQSPLLYGSLTKTEAEKQLFQEASQAYLETLTDGESDAPFREAYIYESLAGSRYHACCAVVPGNTGAIRIFVLAPLDRLEAQIREQRQLFFLVNLIAVLILTLFSWLFTYLLLRPIEKSRKEQVAFIASASHELRTPLSVILSCVSACKKASPSEQESFLNTISYEGRRMKRLVEDMLLLSKTDNNTFTLHPEKTEVDTVVLNVYEGFLPMAGNKKISLALTLPADLFPPCYIDGARLSQVTAIVIHNAISYTPEGGNVWVSLEDKTSTHGCFHITVKDNGIGIPDREKENIFRRFYRVDQSRSIKEHSGLGLSIAAQIIEAMGGLIQVLDTKGGGSTFRITIPVPRPESS